MTLRHESEATEYTFACDIFAFFPLLPRQLYVPSFPLIL